MFSGWDFARSAEAMFSRWAIKRVCKFLLKKRLGDLILGDIDLDQLDVQLSGGTIQLQDLALNVDFLNHKLAGVALMVKEGSIASLSIKIPWKLKNCQIEVEELELVLSPYVGSTVQIPEDCRVTCDDGTQHMDIDSQKLEPETGQGYSGPNSIDVHEGVKTIAKIVKWFLTSFHVRLKNLIVAFDPSSGMDGKRSSLYRSLVIRIAETEFGTCVSEDATMTSDSKLESLLGMAKLTNFIKFKGAVVEFLSMEDVDNQTPCQTDLGTSFSEWHVGSSSLGCSTTVLTGPSGGFSGTLNLSIPWKNGTLDVRRVDADVSIDPVELNLEPSIIRWIIVIWESFKDIGSAGMDDNHSRTADPVCSTSRLYNQAAKVGSSLKEADMLTSCAEHTSENFYSATNQETIQNALLPRTHVIHNWVSLSSNQDKELNLDPDYGASIDQFFSCFDGMRSSQVSSGNSGIWNWTCSVFNAITLASNLASGSVQIPTEQHTETNVQATIAGVSAIILFHSEQQNHSFNFMGSFNSTNEPSVCVDCNLSAIKMNSPLLTEPRSESYMSCPSSGNVNQSTLKEVTSTNLDMHHLEVRCNTVVLDFQICCQKMKFQASIKHIKVDEFYDTGNISGDLDSNNKGSFIQIPLSQQLQRQVQGPLPPFPFAADHDSEEIIVKVNAQRSSQVRLVKVTLFESFGLCSCHYASSSADLDGRHITSASFSVNLPPFVFWIHLKLVNMLLYLSKEVEKSFEGNNMTRDPRTDVLNRRYDAFPLNTVKSGASTYLTTVAPRANIQGNIALPHARFILCFPSEDHGKFRYSTSCDKFIMLELSPCGDTGKASHTFPASRGSCQKGNSCAPSTSIHLNMGNVECYLITPAKRDDFGNDTCLMDGQSFSAIKLLSVTKRADDHHSGITMLWQEGPVTGSWMANRAWSLATPHDQRSKVTGKGSEFSSVQTAETLEEAGSQVCQELILSSAFFLHIRFPCVSINLRNCDNRLLSHLLNYVMDGLLAGAHNTEEIATNKSLGYDHSLCGDRNPSQASILLECDVLDFCIILDELIQPSCSMQKELQGSWKSLRLTVEKFELLSVSNVGEINNSNFLWLNHGEGKLWGSIIDSNDVASTATQDFLLISCRNSAVKRGNGGGINALSFGTAGSAITYLTNPQSLQRFTSIVVRCATILAPGGRFDWVSAICFFFSLPSPEEQSGNHSAQNKISEDGAVYKSCFFLELVDVALSYEPYAKDKLVITEFPDIIYHPAAEPTEHSEEQSVACFLAAASLYLSDSSMTNSAKKDYKFQLQDVGLLICEWTGSKNSRGDYPVDYLRNTGYVKVAQEALVEAVLRILDDHWEVDCSELHITLDSCRDTTSGLARLVAQLQQLYAPDMEDALVHLQSRWNTIQKVHVDDDSDNVVGVSASNSEKLKISNEDNRSVGLLDEILENAFYLTGEHRSSVGYSDLQSQAPVDKDMHEDISELSTSSCAATDIFAPNIPDERSMCSPVMGTHIIESYYLSELLSPSRSASGNDPLNQDHECKQDINPCRDAEFGKGGWYKDDSLMIVENHISKISSQNGELPHQEQNFNSGSYDPSFPCRVSGVVLLKNIDLRWRMYAGYDWSNPRKNPHRHSDLKGRDGSVCLELMLSGTNLQYDIYPDGEICVTKLSVLIRDFHLFDRSKDAPWKMVLGHYHSKDHPRESSSKAFKLDLEAVKPDPSTPLEEYRLHVEFLPMRLHLDQSQLNFLISFFGKDSSVEESQRLHDNLDGTEVTIRKSTSFGSQKVVEEALLPFFQKCIVRPVVVRVDYIPRHFDLAAFRGGNYAELLNLVSWKGIDLHLKDVCALGVYGWSSICETVVGEWLEDISHSQVHKLFQGLPPIKSLFAVSSGVSKLVSLPVKSYKKDHKLLKGMQRGAIAFVKSISLEAIALGVHLAAGAHEILLQTEYILTSTPPSLPVSERSRMRASVRANQPKDAQQGIQQAYESLSDGLGRTASALVGTPLKTYQRGAGAGSALAAAVRSAPVAAMAPVSASARAVHYALLGVRNSLDPEHKKESMEKYLGPSQS